MDPNAKQQVVERLKNASNVLVTVSNNPSVDALAAAIGFSLLLSKLGKHATAVFSGAVPPAIEFLEPGKRFDKDVSGLRDFIIALDKDKADKLRYKVEENVVKIFITPYRTTISKDDLRFEEGDFNVDAVIALGVKKREDLDNAIKAHGRILHDASVLTVNAGQNASSLGTIDWQDPNAGSLSEMLVSITESFGSGLLDEQMSTAFLTGIVAETERFSNQKTTPKVMTMSAQLMAAGANQQLIANNLDLPSQPPPPPPPPTPPPVAEQPPQNDGSQLKIEHDDAQQPSAAPPPPSSQPSPPQAPDNTVAPPPQFSQPTDSGPSAPYPHEKTLQELESEISDLAGTQKGSANENRPKSDKARANQKPTPPPPSESDKEKAKPLTDSYDQHDEAPTSGDMKNQDEKSKIISDSKGHGPRDVDGDQSLGGTFNATSEQAHEDSVSDLKKGKNATLLNHPGKALKEEDEPAEDERPTSRGKDLQPIDKNLSGNQSQPPAPTQQPAAPARPDQSQPPPSVEPTGSQTSNNSQTDENGNDIDAARKAVEEAVSSQPFNPAGNPTQSIGSTPMEQQQPPTGGSAEISIDESGNLRLPNTPQQQPNEPEQGQQPSSQDFQLPKPPSDQG